MSVLKHIFQFEKDTSAGYKTMIEILEFNTFLCKDSLNPFRYTGIPSNVATDIPHTLYTIFIAWHRRYSQLEYILNVHVIFHGISQLPQIRVAGIIFNPIEMTFLCLYATRQPENS